MTDIISIGDSLIITIFSMVLVFVVLMAISYLIEILRITTKPNNIKKPKQQNITVEQKTVEIKDTTTKDIVEETVKDEELIAVISAAIAASLGVPTPQINIKTIKRTTPTAPLWSEAGRREQIFEKL